MQESLPGVSLENDYLRVRIVDNAPRYIHHTDTIVGGQNGIACLFDRKHHKNIFSLCGLQFVLANARPAQNKDIVKKIAPKPASMSLKQTGPNSAQLSRIVEEEGGLNTLIDYELAERHVDQTLTFWSNRDIDGFNTFCSSQMNQVQYTSLFMQGKLEQVAQPQWLEASSAGHSSDGRVYYRTFDPFGKTWADHVLDNPVPRQKHTADPASIAATLKAGFIVNEPNKCPFTGFYYGIIDDYCYLMIFREPAFYFWTCCGGATQRNPTWDYGIAGKPAKAGERVSYHLRLVFKPFAGVEDILEEVRAFRGAYADSLCGEFIE